MATSQPDLFGESAKKDLNKKEVRAALHGKNNIYNRRGRGRSPEEKRKSYAKYRETKRKALEFEKTNTEYLVLWPASDKDYNKEHTFYNMGGNSAIIYVHEIGPRIKRKPVLRHDMDNGNRDEKFHSGVCSVADLDKLTEKLKTINIERVETEDKELVFFKLNREYPPDEVREMLKQEQKRIDALNKVIYSKVLHPDIHKQVLELKKLIPPKIKNMDKTYREVVGMEMMRTLMNLIRSYSQMAHGDIEEKEGAQKMMLEADMILEETSLFNELKLWEVVFCIRIADITNGMRQLLKGKILNK